MSTSVLLEEGKSGFWDLTVDGLVHKARKPGAGWRAG